MRSRLPGVQAARAARGDTGRGTRRVSPPGPVRRPFIEQEAVPTIQESRRGQARGARAFRGDATGWSPGHASLVPFGERRGGQARGPCRGRVPRLWRISSGGRVLEEARGRAHRCRETAREKGDCETRHAGAPRPRRSPQITSPSHAVFSRKVWFPWQTAKLPTDLTGDITPGELQAAGSGWAKL